MDKQLLLALALGTVTGTTLMTMFSYLISRLLNSQFTEPVLLNRFLCGLGFLKEYQLPHHIAGWIIHYAVGLLFLISYYILWSRTAIDPTFLSSVILGSISGVAGIIGWAIVFKIQSVPADMKLGEYYAQLFVGHIIFALTATGTFTLIA